MRRVFGTIWFRILMLILSVCLQLFVYILFFHYFSSYGGIFFVACSLLSAVAVLRIVMKDGSPEYKIAWIIPIMAFPIFGGVFYSIFGHAVLNPRARKRISALSKHLRDYCSESDSALPELEQTDPSAASQARYLERYSFSPLYTGTSASYFSVGEEMYASLLKDLLRAEKFIFLEYFLISDGIMWKGIEDILIQKAKAGVDVRLMYDDLGCVFLLPADFSKKMERLGIRCCAFNPFRHIFNSKFNNRDHRKICVVDGKVGYTGGINLSDEYINCASKFGHWKDTAVRLEGSAVNNLTVMFLSAWDYFSGEHTDFSSFTSTAKVPAKGFVQPFSTSPESSETVGENLYIRFLNKAQRYAYLTTPYLIIDNKMISALSVAAKSGVDVRIITPGIPDKKLVYFLTRSYYNVLLASGVRIFEYSPGFIHSKTAVSDDTTAIIGTINLDYRSLYLHHECAVWMYGNDCVESIRDDFLNCQECCREVTMDSLKKMPARKRFLLAILRIFAPLF